MKHTWTRRSAVGLIGAAATAPLFAAEAPTDETGHIDVPGGKVWYRSVGSGPKTPLLLLHGGPGAGHDYLLPLRALARDRRVIFYDQLGCGRSDAPEDETLYRVPRFVEEVDAVRRALKLDRVILYGHSWGSILAIECAVTGHFDGVEKLILAGALASVPQFVAGVGRLIDAMPHGAGKRLRALEAAGKTDSKEYQDLVGLFYSLYVCRMNPPPPEFLAAGENLQKSPAYRVMNGPNEFTVVGNLKDWDRTSELHEVNVPTLITTGQYDEVSLDCHQTIRAGIKGSRLQIFSGCSHLTMLEQPARYAAALRRFIG